MYRFIGFHEPIHPYFIKILETIFSVLQGDTMGERIGRIRQIGTDFWDLGLEIPTFGS